MHHVMEKHSHVRTILHLAAVTNEDMFAPMRRNPQCSRGRVTDMVVVGQQSSGAGTGVRSSAMATESSVDTKGLSSMSRSSIDEP